MKVLALGSLSKPLTDEQKKQIMPKEVPDTLRLYLDGRIEQFWFSQELPGVIFLMNVDSVEHAKATLDSLPLTEQGLMSFKLLPVGPLSPLGLLLQPK
jgi:hypothetical protein